MQREEAQALGVEPETTDPRLVAVAGAMAELRDALDVLEERDDIPAAQAAALFRQVHDLGEAAGAVAGHLAAEYDEELRGRQLGGYRYP
jgi:hypothetical protein